METSLMRGRSVTWSFGVAVGQKHVSIGGSINIHEESLTADKKVGMLLSSGENNKLQ